MEGTKEAIGSVDSQNNSQEVGYGYVEDVKPAKNFSLFSTLGISFSITCTPIAIGTYLSVSVGVGGSPVFFFGYILAVCLNLCICFSLAEMAAVMPHSSGQIFWTAELAPKKYARGLSYAVGWLASMAYFFWTSASFLITSQLIWALVQIVHADFIIQSWHYYVVYMAIGLISFLFNAPLFAAYPYLLKSTVVYINAGALFIMIVLLVRTHPKQGASYVFTDIVNYTGWTSNGVVFFIGLLPGLTAVNGFDCAAHMAEEVPNPKRQIPQVMVGSALLSAIAGLPMIVVYMFCVTNGDNLLTPVGGQPIAQLLLDSLRSEALTIISVLIIIITFVFASITMLTTWSRVWWSLAREGGTPMPAWLSHTRGKSALPWNAIIFATIACTLIGLLELGSATALNAILGGAILCIFVSYIIPIGLSVGARRKHFAHKHYMNLGKFGFVLNIISIVWISFMFVWLCFPLYVPVTLVTMNWAVVVFFGILFLSAINWFAYSKRKYVAPVAIEETME